MEQIDIDINVNMNNVDEVDELTSRLQEATDEAGTLSDTLDGTSFDGSSVDTGPINEELGEANSEADGLQSTFDELGNTVISPEINVDASGIDEAKESIEETEQSTSSLSTTMAGLAGVIGVDQMISTADRIKTSWNQLDLTFAGTGVSLETLKAKSSEVASATGRSGGQVRSYFNSMGIAGITNTDLLSRSFESLAGKSYQTGQSIESMQGKVQKMVMSGNASSRMLTSLGISTEDLGRAMGVSADEAQKAFEALDQEGRLEALTTAMGDGTEANNMYKNSYEGLKTQAETAMAGLMGAIGEGILPVINPIIQGATSVVNAFSDAFKALPGPVKGAVGGLAGFIAIGTTTAGALGMLGKAGHGVVDGLKSLKSGYDGVKNAMGTAKDMINAYRDAEGTMSGIRAALSAATAAETGVEGANAAAKSAAIAPTTGLAVANNSLLLPILLLVGAVIAVVAVMWYLYNSNESVRNSINGLIAGLQGFIQNIIATGQGIFQFVITSISRLAQFPAKVKQIFTKVISIATSWATSFVQKGWNAAINFVNRVKSGVSRITDAISSALSGVYNAITAPFRRAYDFVMNNVIKPIQNAWNWITSFGSYQGYAGYEGYGDVLNDVVYESSNQNNATGMVVNNNFNGIIEDSVADYIIDTVNDKLRREKLLRGI